MANDNQMLGKRLKCTEDWSSVFSSELQENRNIFSSIWVHCGPISSILHIICAVCLLFPQIMMEAVLIKSGFLAKGNILIYFVSCFHWIKINVENFEVKIVV
jgi:hypothetical protein